MHCAITQIAVDAHQSISLFIQFKESNASVYVCIIQDVGESTGVVGQCSGHDVVAMVTQPA